MRLIIVRHGQSEANVKSLRGMDTRLSARGEEQVKQLSMRLKDEKIDVIFSSDLMRTRQTAQEINKFHNAPIHYVKALRELNHGVLDGKSDKEYLDAQNSSPSIINFRPEGGESWNDLMERVRGFTTGLYEKYKDKTVLISTHAMASRCLLSIYSKIPLEQLINKHTVNTGLIILDVQAKGSKEILNEMFKKG